MHSQSSESFQESSISPAARNILVGTALLVILLFCYGNSFNAAWQYDDFGNIVQNTKVHMDQWSWFQLKQSLSAGLDFQAISRPLAYISFALNYKFGGLNVFGYHLVNFCIHLMASIFVFLFVHNTLRLPLLKPRYAGHATAIAAVASVFWAAHPIQVTAVTYIVQRMASMAGLFYILAMYFHLKGRTATGGKSRIWFFFLCGVTIICALMTKENALMVGYVILLYDLLCIQGISKQNIRATLVKAGIITLAVSMVALFYTDFDFQGLAASYDIRPFTMIERVLTQPRVLFFYISLIVVPMTSRMTLLHDIEISHSLLDPWTTAMAIAGLLIGIIGLGLSVRKYPFLSFCGFFFLLNHAMEASILNLEPIYEHRNYLPSMLIFVPPAAALTKSISFFRYRRSFQWMLGGSAAVVLLSISYTTFAYNRYFKSDLDLWLHTVKCSPGLSLVHNNLGNIYWSRGLFELANTEFVKAYQLDHFFNSHQKGPLEYNLGLYASYRQKDYSLALKRFKAAKNKYNVESKIWLELGRTYFLLGDYAKAIQELSQAVERWPHNSELRYFLSLSYLRANQCQEAIMEAQRALESDSHDSRALMLLAAGYLCENNFDTAIKWYERYFVANPASPLAIITLIELNGIQRNSKRTRFYVQRFRALFKGRDAKDILTHLRFDYQLLPYVPDMKRLSGYIHENEVMKQD